MSDSSMLPQAQIEHELPGRLRLRIPSRRGDRPFFEAAAKRIAELAGVRSLRANPLTGGMLIEHGTTMDTIALFAREHGLFDLPAPVVPVLREAALSAPPVPNPLLLASAGLAGVGVYQVARGQVLGSASENLWNAYAAYTTLKQPWIAAALLGFGAYQAATGPALGSAVSLFLYALNAHRLAQGQAPEATV